jgi:hypothetical protein
MNYWIGDGEVKCDEVLLNSTSHIGKAKRFENDVDLLVSVMPNQRDIFKKGYARNKNDDAAARSTFSQRISLPLAGSLIP